MKSQTQIKQDLIQLRKCPFSNHQLSYDREELKCEEKGCKGYGKIFAVPVIDEAICQALLEQTQDILDMIDNMPIGVLSNFQREQLKSRIIGEEKEDD